MNGANDVKDVIRSPKAVEIMEFLSRNNGAWFGKISDGVGGSNDTVMYRLEDLERVGLVYRREEDGWPYKKCAWLTSKGRRVLSKWREMIQIATTL